MEVKSAVIEPVWLSVAQVVILQAFIESSLFMVCNLIVRNAE